MTTSRYKAPHCHVTVDNARPNANRHYQEQSKGWTLNKLDKLKIYTYNTRGIVEHHILYQLLMELDNIIWHIVGMSETHIEDEELIQLNVSNHLFYNKGRGDKNAAV